MGLASVDPVHHKNPLSVNDPFWSPADWSLPNVTHIFPLPLTWLTLLPQCEGESPESYFLHCLSLHSLCCPSARGRALNHISFIASHFTHSAAPVRGEEPWIIYPSLPLPSLMLLPQCQGRALDHISFIASHFTHTAAPVRGEEPWIIYPSLPLPSLILLPQCDGKSPGSYILHCLSLHSLCCPSARGRALNHISFIASHFTHSAAPVRWKEPWIIYLSIASHFTHTVPKPYLHLFTTGPFNDYMVGWMWKIVQVIDHAFVKTHIPVLQCHTEKQFLMNHASWVIFFQFINET